MLKRKKVRHMWNIIWLVDTPGRKKIYFLCAVMPQITGLKLRSDNKFVSTENILTSYDARQPSQHAPWSSRAEISSNNVHTHAQSTPRRRRVWRNCCLATI